MQKYIRVCEGLSDKGELIPIEEFDKDFSSDKDCYSSIYYYNDEHLKQFQEKGSVAGIRNVETDKLFFDFDSKSNLDLAKQDTLRVIERLKSLGMMSEENFEVSFSGHKGFTIEVQLDQLITPEQAKVLALDVFGMGLTTIDPSIYNASRIIRLKNTKHQVSGLYKVPMTLTQFEKLSTNYIKQYAIEPRQARTLKPAAIDQSLLLKPVKPAPLKLKVETSSDVKEILASKPRHWKDYKWLIAQGYYSDGERHNALMVLAATCRALGYDKEQTYYLCKTSLKKQAERTGKEEFDKNELWKNIIEQSVFSDSWEGGAYSPKSNAWLEGYCTRNAISFEKESSPVVSLDDIGSNFFDYAKNFDQNVIKTGIREFDENVTLLASTLNGLLGQPGSGKTTMALEILRNASKTGVHSTFFSLDMGMPIVYSKLIQKENGKDFKTVMDIYKVDEQEANRLHEKIKESYAHVGFNFKAGLTVNEMRDVILKQEEETGHKSKLVVIDYLECMQSSVTSDPTIGSGLIANQLKDLANELNICILLLLQTQKHSTSDISDPLLSMKKIKGSSVLEQSMSVITTLWREGYSPDTVKDDIFISFALVKNRFGGLWRGDFHWDPIKGNIRSLADEEYDHLEEFKKRKADARKKADSSGWEN